MFHFINIIIHLREEQNKLRTKLKANKKNHKSLQIKTIF